MVIPCLNIYHDWNIWSLYNQILRSLLFSKSNISDISTIELIAIEFPYNNIECQQVLLINACMFLSYVSESYFVWSIFESFFLRTKSTYGCILLFVYELAV